MRINGLSEVDVELGGVTATHEDDGHRRCVLITEPGAPRRVQFHNSAGLLLAEIGTNTSNTTTELKTYFYQGRNLVAERLRTLSQDTTNYVHSDHLGSPVARTNTAGYAYERTLYEVYGLKSNSAPNGPYGVGLFPDGIGFAGHRVDRVSGLSYMQQRYYDPVAGRFISPDPVPADAGALFNRYAYANNNPVNFIDPDGQQPRRRDGGAGAEIGLLVAEAFGLIDSETANGIRAGITDGKVRASREGPVKPGDRGSYGELKSQKEKYGETEDLDMDKRPSFAATRKSHERERGRALTPSELEQLRREAPAVATPRRDHQQWSRTYGGRNTPEQIDRDSRDLEGAAQLDDAVMVIRVEGRVDAKRLDRE